jgi:hypothetical protein
MMNQFEPLIRRFATGFNKSVSWLRSSNPPT